MAQPTAKQVLEALDAQNRKHTVHAITEKEIQEYLTKQPERATKGRNASQIAEDMIAVRYTI
jgi:hypothetical protein